MADKETGLNISVSAVADKNSAKEAVNELTKDVLSSLKDGYIKIPAELKVPIKGASKDLEKAQKDVIRQWEKTFKEGFSSSAKDLEKNLDALTEAHHRFKKLTGQQHKANTKQAKGLSAIMDNPIQTYVTSKKNMQTMKVKIDKQNNTRRNKVSQKEADKLLKEEIDHAVARHEREQKNKKDKILTEFTDTLKLGAGRSEASRPGAPTKLGLRMSMMDGPYVSEQTLRMSEISPYRNLDEVRKAKELAKIRKAERDSLTSRKATTKELEDARKRVELREATGRSQNGTEYELIRKALRTELKKIQDGLVKGKSDATSQKLIEHVLSNLTYDEEKGIDPLKSVTDIHESLFKRYNTTGKTGTTDGNVKGEGENQEEANETLTQIYKILGQFIDARQSIIDNLLAIKSELLGGNTTRKESAYERELARIQGSEQMKAMKSALNPLVNTTSKINIQNMRDSSRDIIADQAEARTSRSALSVSTDTLGAVRDDAASGFNSETRTIDLIKSVNSLGDDISILIEIRDILQQIAGKGKGGTPIGGGRIKQPDGLFTDLPTDMVINPETGLFYKTKAKGKRGRRPKRPKFPSVFHIGDEEYEGRNYHEAFVKSVAREIEEEIAQMEKGKHSYQQRTFLEPSQISTSQKGFFGQLRKRIKDKLPQTEVDRIMSANAEEQARMRAERIETYGLNRGRELTDTGDIADVKRTKSLFGWVYNNDKKNKQLFQDIKLTPGFTGKESIDTTKIMEALNNVLSGPEMFKAQTGGTLRNIIGSMTGYIGMDSIEKSRAQAEGLNQVMASVRNEVLGLIQDVQAKEATLIGMQERGAIRFDKEGRPEKGASLAAENVFNKLEEQKGVLRAALAEVAMIDQVVAKSGGRVSKIIKNLGFVMPELMKNNTIIQNINAGLDKNGKALKFQTRMAEILNYSFQLMSRHIGQIIKNWIWMINPLNMMKKAFDDFASYDPKWQRTMNVVKNNLREIILPFMQKIAQTLVNIIGFFDIILMKIQAAFGHTPISLFDQENANEFKKTYEEIQNVTASFDELHDIGSSNGENDPNDLLGEIYKPQLSQRWIDLANEIGDLFAGIITGDLGFGEAMKKILLGWNGLLGKILALFLGWKLLKIAGSTLFNALFGKLTLGNIKGIFNNIGDWIVKTLGATSFGSGILQGLSNVLVNGGGLIKTLKYAFTYPGLITQMGGWGQMLGMIFIQSLGAAVGGIGIAAGFDKVADSESYNIGLMNAGGNKDDKKSGIGGRVLGTVTGAIGGGMLIGGPIGAAIGGITGLLITSLAPAFEKVEVATRNANNEMQKIEYYQGAVQGYSTEVSKLEELQRVLNNTLNLQTQKVYEEGEQLGITKTRMDELVSAVQNGTFHASMLTEAEIGLKDSLVTLNDQQIKNTEATKKLENAKRNLQKAEIDLAIAKDAAAGNFEMAAARIEYAVASELMSVDEGTKKMVQIAKEGSAEQAAAMLRDMSPDLQKKFQKEYGATQKGLNELTKMYYKYSKDERQYFVQNLTGEVQQQMQSRVDAIGRAVQNAPWWKRLLDIRNDGKILGRTYVDVPGYATGTNYVPSDGLAYLHKGEAVIPAKYNEGVGIQGKAYQEQAHVNNQLMVAIARLENTMKQGINVNGQFVQRGSDLVAVVNKTKSQSGADLLSNVSYAR